MKPRRMKKTKIKKVKLVFDYHKDVDIASFYWGKKKGVQHSRELKTNVLIDFDKKDNIIGIEIMDFRSALEESQKEINRIFKLQKKR